MLTNLWIWITQLYNKLPNIPKPWALKFSSWKKRKKQAHHVSQYWKIKNKKVWDWAHSILAGASVVQETEVCLARLVAAVNLPFFWLAPVCSNKGKVSRFSITLQNTGVGEGGGGGGGGGGNRPEYSRMKISDHLVWCLLRSLYAKSMEEIISSSKFSYIKMLVCC